ncbi:MAG: hypothetical protein J6Z31_06035 [Fibrobacter sp.]|nr:hypothetical protein [Fibrobacter sp.]
MENLVTVLITLAIIAYSAYRKSKRQGHNEPLPPDTSWEQDDVEEDVSEEAPPVPDPLQDLIRKFREEQAKTAQGDASPKVVPSKKIVEADQKTFEHQSKRIESSYAPKKDFTRISKNEEVKPVFVPMPEPEVSSFKLEETLPQTPLQRKSNFDLNIKDARKGFLWAKVLDDPRFKRRSPFTLDRRG